MPSLLEVSDLTVEFESPSGLIRAVDGVSLRLEAGSVLGLVGESGSGKSSTARAIMRLVPARSGHVLVNGIDLLTANRTDLRRLRRDVQMVFQDPYASLDPRFTAEQTIGEGIDIHGLAPNRSARRDRIVDLLDLVGMSSDQLQQKPHALSGGQRQRIAIARALAVEPKLLICDEPVTALDASIRAQVMNLFADLRDRLGLAFLFISHDLSMIRHFAHEVAVMQDGRIVEHGDRAQVVEAPQHPHTRALLLAAPVVDPSLARAQRDRRMNAVRKGALAPDPSADEPVT